MPFVTAGDPDLEFTAAVLAELVARGSSLCELGIPYSDPIADGPGDSGVVHAGAWTRRSSWPRFWRCSPASRRS